MTDEQKAAYIISQAAILMAKVAGMQAENQFRSARDETVAYVESDFQREMDQSGCWHNDVLGLFHS